jgi:DNA-binding transcriptional ArsR family regulator
MPTDRPRRPAAKRAEIDGRELDSVFAALADPVRRAILSRLDEGEFLVSELAEPFAISLQAVSKHIQVLVKAGLVVQERTGRISRCRLDAGPIYQAAVWINRYSKYWQTQFDTLAAWLGEVETGRDPASRSAKTAIRNKQPAAESNPDLRQSKGAVQCATRTRQRK